MMRPAVLGLFLACAVALSSSAVVLENGAPVLWSQTAAQESDLPLENGLVTLNPWNFIHRQSLYRVMIAVTDPYMGVMGTNATDSPIWGLPLQLGWLVTSGRLADPTGTTTCGLQTGDPMCISTQSWWGCMSYFVSVLPFLSAAKQFLTNGVQMTAPEGVSDYCTTYESCLASYPDAMNKWDAFFTALKETSTLPSNERKDQLLGLYWDAQMASMSASTACNSRQSHYSSKEVAFAKSWLNSAEYIAAAHFQTNLANSAMFSQPLPGRPLQETDSPPNIPDMSNEENHTLSVFSWLDWVNTVLGGSLVRSWRSAMCSVTTRERGRDLMAQLLLNPGFASATFMTIIAEMTTSC